jgi:hypothetical protein
LKKRVEFRVADIIDKTLCLKADDIPVCSPARSVIVCRIPEGEERLAHMVGVGKGAARRFSVDRGADMDGLRAAKEVRS